MGSTSHELARQGETPTNCSRSTRAASISRPRRSRSCAAIPTPSSTRRFEVGSRAHRLESAPRRRAVRADDRLPKGVGARLQGAVPRAGGRRCRGRRSRRDVVGGEDLAKRSEGGLRRLRSRDRDARHDVRRRPPGRILGTSGRCPTRKSATARGRRQGLRRSRRPASRYRTDRIGDRHLGYGKGRASDEGRLPRTTTAVVEALSRAKRGRESGATALDHRSRRDGAGRSRSDTTRTTCASRRLPRRRSLPSAPTGPPEPPAGPRYCSVRAETGPGAPMNREAEAVRDRADRGPQ